MTDKADIIVWEKIRHVSIKTGLQNSTHLSKSRGIKRYDLEETLPM